MASNLLNVDTTALSTYATGSSAKSFYAGAYPAGVNWVGVYMEALGILVGNSPSRPAVRALLNSTVNGRKVYDTDNSGGAITLSDVLNIIKYRNKSLTDNNIASWISANIEDVMIADKNTYIADSSYYDPNSATPVVSIFGGASPAVLDDPVGNMANIFFHTSFDYLRVKSIIDFDVTLPARNHRVSGGGKKSSQQLMSYNGYSDLYIYQHDYGSPPPVFSVFLRSDAANSPWENVGLTGSLPLQFYSSNTFRLGMVYSTDKYLVLRERYQVYNGDLVAKTLKLRAYFYENPTSVQSGGSFNVVHSPSIFDETQVYTGTPRSISTTISFTMATPGETFNRVQVGRTGGANNVKIDYIDGSSVTPFDPNAAYITYDYSQRSSWSFRFTTSMTGAGQLTSNSFKPQYVVKFINTANGKQTRDYISGYHNFPKQ